MRLGPVITAGTGVPKLAQAVHQRARVNFVPDRPEPSNNCSCRQRQIFGVIAEHQAVFDPLQLRHCLAAGKHLLAETVFFGSNGGKVGHGASNRMDRPAS